jgi:hypothetical protein
MYAVQGVSVRKVTEYGAVKTNEYIPLEVLLSYSITRMYQVLLGMLYILGNSKIRP